MKIVQVVLISDTHDRHNQIKDVPYGDILVHAGDMTMMGREQQIIDAGMWLRSLPHKHKIVIAGNHDWMFEKEPTRAKTLLGEGIIYLENSGVEVEGLRFWGSPQTPWFYDWAFNVPRDGSIRKYWDQIPAGLDMLITHGPPKGILDQACPKKNTEHCGCEYLLATVKEKKPKVHVFGHIHGSGGSLDIQGETAFRNASVVNEQYNVVYPPRVENFCTED